MTFQKRKVFYSNKEHRLKRYNEITSHNNLTKLSAEVSKFSASLVLALETNLKTKLRVWFMWRNIN